MDGDRVGDSETLTASGHFVRQLLRRVDLLESECDRLRIELELERQENGLLRQKLAE